MSMKMYANMAHMQYHLRCHFTGTLQVWELTQKYIKLSSQLAHYVFNEYTNFDLKPWKVNQLVTLMHIQNNPTNIIVVIVLTTLHVAGGMKP